jgi:aryl-alcohol dehydrogenase-like predicted oxidoreductase
MNVPELILGTAQLTTNYGITRGEANTMTTSSATAFLRRAREIGITSLDTAPAYGHAEAVIGECGTHFGVHTKLRRGVDEVVSLTQSLARLRVAEVDILYVHDIAAFEADPQRATAGLRRCLDHGARRLGVSVYTPAQLRTATEQPVVSAVQFPLNILDRRFLGAPIATARAAGFRCLARSAFLQGVLLANVERLDRRVQHLATAVTGFQHVAARLNVSPVVAAFAWVAHQTGIDGVVVGAGDQRELDELNEAWHLAVALDPAMVDELSNRVTAADGVDPRSWV